MFFVSLRGDFPGKGSNGICMRHVSILVVSEITCACISQERLRQFQVSALNNDHLVVLHIVVSLVGGSHVVSVG